MKLKTLLRPFSGFRVSQDSLKNISKLKLKPAAPKTKPKGPKEPEKPATRATGKQPGK